MLQKRSPFRLTLVLPGLVILALTFTLGCQSPRMEPPDTTVYDEEVPIFVFYDRDSNQVVVTPEITHLHADQRPHWIGLNGTVDNIEFKDKPTVPTVGNKPKDPKCNKHNHCTMDKVKEKGTFPYYITITTTDGVKTADPQLIVGN